MLEYLPWSNKELNSTLELYKKGILSIIDFELGGSCNFSCIYCDSPNRKINVSTEVENIELLLADKRVNWLFVCGLGEPLFENNKKILLELLKLCRRYNVKCSVFTNGFNIDNEILQFVEDNILYLLIKLDSLQKNKIQKIYSTDKGNVLLDNLKKIEDYIIVSDNKYTNIAASIVPTKLNEDEILDIVDYCFNKNMFPLIGLLEYAGSAMDKFKEINISSKILKECYKKIVEITNNEYSVPICPSVIGGIHIGNDSNIVVDKSTGLSCSWFWLKTPEVHTICDFNSSTTLDEITNRIIKYRSDCINQVSTFLESGCELPLGGCGGDTRKLLKRYLSIHPNVAMNDEESISDKGQIDRT